MKKLIAIVLALTLVFSLAPMAFASTTTLTADEYTVTATVTLGKYDSVEYDYWETTVTDTDDVPRVLIEIPYDAIGTNAGSGLWDEDDLDIKIELTGIDSTFTSNQDATTVYVNSSEKEAGEDFAWITGASNGIEFYVAGLTSTSATLSYNVKFVYEDADGNQTTESVLFYVEYQNTAKNSYALKFSSGEDVNGAYDVVLKDGVFFVDSTTNAAADVDNIEFVVTKNDGSKFTEKAYYSQHIDDYVAAKENKVLDSDDSTIVVDVTKAQAAPDTTTTYYVTVETEYGIYQGELKVKFRTNVEMVDPKGISFEKDTYTIGVNEVLEPSYNTIVDVYYDIGDDVELAVTASTELNVIDVDGNKITGLKEGTAYVVATYEYCPDGTNVDATYTDTAKIVVSGVYEAGGTSSYVVTTSSSNLNVRSGPGTSYSKLTSLAKGTVVEVLSITDGWAKIQLDNYTNAYVSASYLTKQSSSTSSVGTKTVIARVLNVRSGAGTSYSIVGQLNRNTQVEVIETVPNGSWSKISFGTGYAYVSSTYLQ